MANHVTGTSTPFDVLASCLGALRQHVLVPLIGNPLFSEAEQLRANHFVHETDDVARLTRWYANVLAESTRRQAVAAHQRGQATLRATLGRLSLNGFRGSRSRKSPTPAWSPGAPLPDLADRLAGTFDRLAAARFRLADALTLAMLLSCPSQ
jgi:hypothetical protein